MALLQQLLRLRRAQRTPAGQLANLFWIRECQLFGERRFQLGQKELTCQPDLRKKYM
jgi:hypothetical protein